jgi:hypothetical protein
MQHTLAVWLKQTRANFLVLAVFLALGGIGLSKALGTAPGITDSVLIVIGVVLAHTAVNLFNEYSDHRTGIDRAPTPPPFSAEAACPRPATLRPVRFSSPQQRVCCWPCLSRCIFLSNHTGW